MLRDWLRKKQLLLHETDTEFGRRLGLSRQGWRKARLAKSDVSKAVAQAARRAFALSYDELCQLYFVDEPNPTSDAA